MGGNVQVKNYKAQKIPIKKIGLKKFQNDFKELFKTLNKMFYKKYKKYIWNNEKILDNGFVFNGSTSFLMDPGYLDKEEELTLLKPTSGDIDIMVPENLKSDLWHFLKNIEGKTIGNFTYIGCNKPSVTSINDQINCLFEYNYGEGKIFAQTDFEFVPFSEVNSEWYYGYVDEKGNIYDKNKKPIGVTIKDVEFEYLK